MLRQEKQSYQDKWARILEVFLEMGPLSLYGVERELENGHHPIDHHVAHDVAKALSRQEFIRIVKRGMFRNAVEKKDYNITASGTMFLFLKHAESFSPQRCLFYGGQGRDIAPKEMHEDKAIPSLYPKDRLWENLIGLIKRQSLYRGFPIPDVEVSALENSEELLRTLVLLGMHVFLGYIESGRRAMGLVGASLPPSLLIPGADDIGLDSWSNKRPVADFFLSLLSVDTLLPFGLDMRPGYLGPRFMDGLISLLQSGRSGNQELIKQDISLLKKQAVNYVRQRPRIFECMRIIFKLRKDDLDGEIFYMKDLKEVVDSLESN